MIFDGLWRLKWRRGRYEQKTNRQINNLRKQEKFPEANALSSELQDELNEWQQAIWARRTKTLVAAAERLDVPVSYEKICGDLAKSKTDI